MSGQSPIEDADRGRKGSVFGRMSQRFQEAIDTGRGDERPREAVDVSVADPAMSAGVPPPEPS